MKSYLLVIGFSLQLFSLDSLCQKKLQMQEETLKILQDKQETKKIQNMIDEINHTKTTCTNQIVLDEAKQNIADLEESFKQINHQINQSQLKSSNQKLQDQKIQREVIHQELIAAKQYLLRLKSIIQDK